MILIKEKPLKNLALQINQISLWSTTQIILRNATEQEIRKCVKFTKK